MKQLIVLFIQLVICTVIFAESRKPNIVLIVVDDLGWKDIACMGSDFHQTPNIDKLADDGFLFVNSYASCTVCSPSRASIMTGKYPARLNCTDWIEGYNFKNTKYKSPNWTMYLDTAEVTIAEVLKDNGYSTIHIGKWHLGEDEIHWPLNQGFDKNIGGWSFGSPHRNKKKGYNGYFPPFGNPTLDDHESDTYLTDRLASEACNYIKTCDNKMPFFINLWFYSVHTPLQAKKDKIDKYKSLVDTSYTQQNPIYAAMVEHMDEAVGKVIQELKEQDLYNNTIIIFASDNGGLIGRGYQVTSNLPARGGKGQEYEGGVRTPLIIVDGRENRKGIIAEPVISCDYFPTLVDMASLNVKRGTLKAIDGVNLNPLMKGHKIKNRALYWHYPHYHTEGATPYSAVLFDGYQLIRWFEHENVDLYDIKNHRKQTINSTDDEKVNQLMNKLNNWYKEVDAQMPLER